MSIKCFFESIALCDTKNPIYLFVNMNLKLLPFLSQ